MRQKSRAPIGISKAGLHSTRDNPTYGESFAKNAGTSSFSEKPTKYVRGHGISIGNNRQRHITSSPFCGELLSARCANTLQTPPCTAESILCLCRGHDVEVGLLFQTPRTVVYRSHNVLLRSRHPRLLSTMIRKFHSSFKHSSNTRFIVIILASPTFREPSSQFFFKS